MPRKKKLEQTRISELRQIYFWNLNRKEIPVWKSSYNLTVATGNSKNKRDNMQYSTPPNKKKDRALANTTLVIENIRARFLGKISPLQCKNSAVLSPNRIETHLSYKWNPCYWAFDFRMAFYATQQLFGKPPKNEKPQMPAGVGICRKIATTKNKIEISRWVLKVVPFKRDSHVVANAR